MTSEAGPAVCPKAAVQAWSCDKSHPSHLAPPSRCDASPWANRTGRWPGAGSPGQRWHPIPCVAASGLAAVSPAGTPRRTRAPPRSTSWGLCRLELATLSGPPSAGGGFSASGTRIAGYPATNEQPGSASQWPGAWTAAEGRGAPSGAVFQELGQQPSGAQSQLIVLHGPASQGKWIFKMKINQVKSTFITRKQLTYRFMVKCIAVRTKWQPTQSSQTSPSWIALVILVTISVIRYRIFSSISSYPIFPVTFREITNIFCILWIKKKSYQVK